MTQKLRTDIIPPKARKIPHDISQLGFTRRDDYAWLKDENWQAMMADSTLLDGEIRKHLEIENGYAADVMADIAPLQDEIFEEMKPG